VHLNNKETQMDEKTQIAAQVLALGNNSEQLKMVANIVAGHTPEAEKYLTLRAVATEVGLHPTWLHRLKVPEICGHRIAGRKRYRVSEVQAYLESDSCHARVRELSNERKSKSKGEKNNEF